MKNMIWFYSKTNINRNLQITSIRRLYYDEKGISAMKTIINLREITQE